MPILIAYSYRPFFAYSYQPGAYLLIPLAFWSPFAYSYYPRAHLPVPVMADYDPPSPIGISRLSVIPGLTRNLPSIAGTLSDRRFRVKRGMTEEVE